VEGLLNDTFDAKLGISPIDPSPSLDEW